MYLSFFSKLLIACFLIINNTSVNAQAVICEACDGYCRPCENDQGICIGKVKVEKELFGRYGQPPKVQVKCEGRVISFENATVKEMFIYNQKLAETGKLLNDIAHKLSSVPNLTNDSLETKNILNNAITSNNELRFTINTRFDQLPSELIAIGAIKKLREDILLEIDRRISASQ